MPKERFPLSKLLHAERFPLKEYAEAIVSKYGDPDKLEVIRKVMVGDMQAINEEQRTAIHYVNTRDIDRDHEIVVPKGIILDEFRLAPQVFWSHNYTELIGSDDWIRLDAGAYGLVAQTRHATTPFADKVFTWIKEGHLRTSSIGFVPLESIERGDPGWERLIKQLARTWQMAPEEFDGAERITTKSLLLEHSWAGVISNIYARLLEPQKAAGQEDTIARTLDLASDDYRGLMRRLADDSNSDPPPMEWPPKDELEEVEFIVCDDSDDVMAESTQAFLQSRERYMHPALEPTEPLRPVGDTERELVKDVLFEAAGKV